MEPDIHTQIFTTMSDGPKQTQTLRKTITARVCYYSYSKCYCVISYTPAALNVLFFLFLPLVVSLDGPPPTPLLHHPPPVSLAVWDGDHSTPSREITPEWWAAHGPPLHWLRWSTPRTPTSDRFSAETPQSDSASGGVLGILNSTPGF